MKPWPARTSANPDAPWWQTLPVVGSRRTPATSQKAEGETCAMESPASLLLDQNIMERHSEHSNRRGHRRDDRVRTIRVARFLLLARLPARTPMLQVPNLTVAAATISGWSAPFSFSIAGKDVRLATFTKGVRARVAPLPTAQASSCGCPAPASVDAWAITRHKGGSARQLRSGRGCRARVRTQGGTTCTNRSAHGRHDRHDVRHNRGTALWCWRRLRRVVCIAPDAREDANAPRHYICCVCVDHLSPHIAVFSERAPLVKFTVSCRPLLGGARDAALCGDRGVGVVSTLDRHR